MTTTPPVLPRRAFLGRTLALGALPAMHRFGDAATADAGAQAPNRPERRVKLGVVACGGRGGWIARLFAKHGGYEMHAVADYFPAVGDATGEVLGVPAARRFSGLSGYRRLIESGVEAVALETPPYFFPEHARRVLLGGDDFPVEPTRSGVVNPIAFGLPIWAINMWRCRVLSQLQNTAFDLKWRECFE